MNAKLLTTVRHPSDYVNANLLICKADEPKNFIFKIEYLDANGKPESTTVGWKRISADDLLDVLVRTYALDRDEAIEIVYFL